MRCGARHVFPAATLPHPLTRSLAGDQDDDNLGSAAEACLDLLTTLLAAVKEEPAIMQRLGQQMLPLVRAILDPEKQLLEFFDAGITLLEWLVCVRVAGGGGRPSVRNPTQTSVSPPTARLLPSFATPELGPPFWDAYCALMDCYYRFAMDYLPNMIIVVDHYMSRATDVMATQGRGGQTYVDMALGMLPKALEKGWTSEAGYGCMITQSVFFHCRGRVDDKVPGTLSTLMNALVNACKKIEQLQAEAGGEGAGFVSNEPDVLRVRASAPLCLRTAHTSCVGGGGSACPGDPPVPPHTARGRRPDLCRPLRPSCSTTRS